MPPQQTPAQRQAAMTAAGLSSIQQAGVTAGRGYTVATNPPPVFSSGGGAIIPQGGAVGTAVAQPATGTVSNNLGQTAPITTSGSTAPAGGVGADPTFSAAQAAMAPGATPTPPPAQQSFFDAVRSQLQPILDKITENEQAAEQAANAQASREMQSYGAQLGAQGLAGSSAGASTTAAVYGNQLQNIAAAKQAQTAAMADIFKFTSQQAQAGYDSAYAQYQDALQRNDTQSQNYVATQQKFAQNSVKSAAMNGITIDKLKQTKPEDYQKLLQYYMGDENQMKTDWIAAAAPLSLDGGKPIQAGSHLIYTFRDPVTQQTFTQDIDTGIPLSQDFETAKSADGSMYLVNKATGETKQMTSPDPYYQANKALTLQSKQLGMQRTSQLMQARNVMIAKNAMNTALGTGGKLVIDTYSKTVGPAARIQNAFEGNYGAVGDQELVDAMTIINSGYRPTVQQVDAIVSNQGLGDKAGVELKKALENKGGFLGDDAKKAIFELAKKNFSVYQSQYQKVLPQAQQAVTASGAKFNLTDISQLNLLQTPDSDLQAMAGGGGSDGGDITTQIQTAGGQDNGDGTYTMPDGSVVDPNQ